MRKRTNQNGISAHVVSDIHQIITLGLNVAEDARSGLLGWLSSRPITLKIKPIGSRAPSFQKTPDRYYNSSILIKTLFALTNEELSISRRAESKSLSFASCVIITTETSPPSKCLPF